MGLDSYTRSPSPHHQVRAPLVRAGPQHELRDRVQAVRGGGSVRGGAVRGISMTPAERHSSSTGPIPEAERHGPLSRLEPPIWARAIRQIARRRIALEAALLAPPRFAQLECRPLVLSLIPTRPSVQ